MQIKHTHEKAVGGVWSKSQAERESRMLGFPDAVYFTFVTHKLYLMFCTPASKSGLIQKTCESRL